VTISVTPDDGETVGQLKRPRGGFGLRHGYQIVSTAGLGAEDRGPTSPDEPWLIPVGPPESIGWPRAHPGVLESFASLHSRSDAAISRFASRYGWLEAGTLLARDPVDMSGSGGDVQPVWGDRVTTWRRESRLMGDLVGLVQSARVLRRRESAYDRARITNDPEGRRTMVWVSATDQGLEGRTTPGQPMSWHSKPGDGPPHRPLLAFVYGHGGERFVFVPMAQTGAPAWGSNLERADRRELATLAFQVAERAADAAIRARTHGTLTLAKGVRVAPAGLLGSLYLLYAADVFERGTWKVCRQCRKEFEPVRADQIYDSEACRAKAYRQRLTTRRKP
jgi:hypothetical protein